jgi:hypothetical protein
VQKELDILGSRNALPADFREVIRMLEERRFPVNESQQSCRSKRRPKCCGSGAAIPQHLQKLWCR